MYTSKTISKKIYEKCPCVHEVHLKCLNIKIYLKLKIWLIMFKTLSGECPSVGVGQWRFCQYGTCNFKSVHAA